MNSLLLLLLLVFCIAYTGLLGAQAAPGDYTAYCNGYIRVDEGCQYYGWGSKWGYITVSLANAFDQPSTSLTAYTDPADTLTTQVIYKDYFQGTDYSTPYWRDKADDSGAMFLAEIRRGDDGQNLPLKFYLNTKCGTFLVTLSSGFTFCFLYQQCGTCV